MFAVQAPSVSRKPRLKAGTGPLGVLLAALALLVGLAGPAAAESTTVTGSGGDLQELFVNNGATAVVAKVHGADIECGVSKWVLITMQDRDGTNYTAKGGCYPGDPSTVGGWHKSLERGAKLVACGFSLKYNITGGFWRFQVPRSCLGRLANGITVTAELASSATPGVAGPTQRLSRG